MTSLPFKPLPDDVEVIKGLREGNEQMFEMVVDRYSGSLLRLAMAYVSSGAVAEEVVQETWLAVFEGIGRFEGRSSFQTWVFRILSNRAKSRGVRESRYEPMGLGTAGDQTDEPILESSLFMTEGSRAGHWKVPPGDWEPETPERALLSKECRGTIERAIAALPSLQQQVITLRDLEGISSGDICNILDISETNQRVLLHRARVKVRRVLDQYLSHEKPSQP